MLKIEFTNSFDEIKKEVQEMGGKPIVTIQKNIVKSIEFRTEKVIEKIVYLVVVKVGNQEIVYKSYPAFYEALWVSQNLEFALNR